MFNHARSAILVGVILALISATTVEAQSTTTVELQGGNVFSPANITITAGDTVHWVWVAGFHNVESGAVVSGSGVHDGYFRSGNPTAVGGTTWDFTFTQAFVDANPAAGNVYLYYCDPHAGVGMIGTVTVQAAGACSADTDCDDSNACNGTETCTSNACVSGTALDCDDQKPCTDDSCDTSLGCLNIGNNSNTCDDGDGCTADTCTAGECVSTAIAGCVACTADAECNDSNPCTTDTCTSSACQSADNTLPCDDGDPCTDSDTCGGGSCAGTTNDACCLVDADCGTAAECTTVACVSNACVTTSIQNCKSCAINSDCDDGNACTDDVCNASLCQYTDNSASCDDGNACTENDVCSASSCSGTAIVGCGDSSTNDGTGSTTDGAGTTDGTGTTDGSGTSDSGSTTTSPCGAAGMIMFLGMFLGLGLMRFSRRG